MGGQAYNMEKFALMVYDYGGSEVYKPGSVNIGDYVQSLAAKQFIPHVDQFIDRDSIKYYCGSSVKMIMNGWWTGLDGIEELSPQINPLFISYHIDSHHLVSSGQLKYLKKHEPIGCRDLATKEFLEKKGIKAYFSGCLTLSLGRTYGIKESERQEKVIFNEVEMRKIPSLLNLKKLFSKGMKFSWRKRQDDLKINQLFTMLSGANEISRTNHQFPLGRTYDEYFLEAELLLKEYARAKLVVTSRIHCALPCIGMGVPVLLVFEEFDKFRYRGILEFMNFIGFSSNGALKYNLTGMVSDDMKMVLFAPNRHLECEEALVKKVQDFVQFG